MLAIRFVYSKVSPWHHLSSFPFLFSTSKFEWNMFVHSSQQIISIIGVLHVEVEVEVEAKVQNRRNNRIYHDPCGAQSFKPDYTAMVE